MSDRSYFQAIFHEVAPDEMEALRDVIDDAGLTLSYAEDEPADGQVMLFEAYTSDEEVLDFFETFAKDVIDAAPNTSFQCWIDPKYEWMGGISMYTHALGLWTGDCTATGQPILTTAEYLSKPDLSDRLSILHKALGIDHYVALQEMAMKHEREVRT